MLRPFILHRSCGLIWKIRFLVILTHFEKSGHMVSISHHLNDRMCCGRLTLDIGGTRGQCLKFGKKVSTLVRRMIILQGYWVISELVLLPGVGRSPLLC